MNDRALSYISLGKKGRNLVFGEATVGDACRAGTAVLILLAQDAAAGSARRAEHAAGGSVPVLPLPYTKDQLGAALGKDVCAAAAFTDAGLALAFVRALERPEIEIIQALEQRLEAQRPPQKRPDRKKKNVMEVAR